MKFISRSFGVTKFQKQRDSKLKSIGIKLQSSTTYIYNKQLAFFHFQFLGKRSKKGQNHVNFGVFPKLWIKIPKKRPIHAGPKSYRLTEPNFLGQIRNENGFPPPDQEKIRKMLPCRCVLQKSRFLWTFLFFRIFLKICKSDFQNRIVSLDTMIVSIDPVYIFGHATISDGEIGLGTFL